MLLIEGKHTCQDCNKEFEWFYIVPQRYNEPINAYQLPRDKVGLRVHEENKDRTPISGSAYCPNHNCGYNNIFELDYGKIVKTK